METFEVSLVIDRVPTGDRTAWAGRTFSPTVARSVGALLPQLIT